jgi:hypothetical protein
MNPTPTTQEEFDRVMEEIDSELRAANVQIHARALHAAGQYSRLFHLEFPLFPCADKGSLGVYTGADIGAHIQKWFDDRYGDRQKIFMGPGSSVIVLRGDPWEIRLPRIYGTIQCVVERDLRRYASEHNVPTDGQPPIQNLLMLINDFPPGLASQLTDEECFDILEIFKHSIDCMHAIEYIAGNPYVREAMSDIQASVRHIFAVPPHNGQSKWSSAQAAEKFLKSFLKVKGISFPFSHDIRGLADLSETGGMKALEHEIIDQLQTRAAVRYGDHPVSLIESVAAHHASLLVGKHISEALVPA